MASNFGRVVIYNEGSLYKVTRSFDHVVLQIHVKYFSCCITTTTKPMAMKLCKVVTYYKKLQPSK